MGTIGATFYVIGIGLLYLVTGSLNFADIAARLASANDAFPRPVMAALAFLFVGISLKLAPDYLGLKNILCVGGSWVAPKDAMARGDWAAITTLAAEAAALAR